LQAPCIRSAKSSGDSRFGAFRLLLPLSQRIRIVRSDGVAALHGRVGRGRSPCDAPDIDRARQQLKKH
jgi:hypothetical protein